MITYFISDFHFNHTSIIEYCNRPFKSIESMNATLVHNFLDTVRENDTCYILGDIIDTSYLKYFTNRKLIIMQM